MILNLTEISTEPIHTQVVRQVHRLRAPSKCPANACHVGDRLVLFSDGLPEAETEAGEPFGYDRLRTLIADSATARGTAHPADDPETWLDGWLESLRRQTAVLQRDDWTAMALERRR